MVTRVLIADAFPIHLIGLQTLLSQHRDIEIVATAADGEAAVRLALAVHPDVLVIELDLPLLRGIVALTRVRQTLPDVRAVFLTGPQNERWREMAAKAGAWGFLTKDADPTHLASMIRNVHAGRSYLCGKDLVQRAAARTDSAFRRSLFSDREIFIWRQIVAGKTSRDIAAILERSHRTVDKQRESLRIKLGVHNSAELAAIGAVYFQELDLLAAGEAPPVE